MRGLVGALIFVWAAIIELVSCSNAPQVQAAVYQRVFVDRPKMNISMAYFADASDSLFVIIQNSAHIVAKLLNVTLLGALPTSSPDGQGTLPQQIRDAIAAHSMGLISTLHTQAITLPLLTAAAQGGAAIGSYNNGYDEIKPIGTIAAVAEDLYKGGVALGKALGSNPYNVHNPMCITLNLDATYAVQRCTGALDGYNAVTGKNLKFNADITVSDTVILVEVDNSPVTSTANVAQSRNLATYLDAHPTVDALFLTQAALIPNVKAGIAMMANPRNIYVGCDDYNTNVRAELDAPITSTGMNLVIAEGQQPFIQGFMSILYMFTHLALNETVSDYLIASGPFVVDSTVSSKERADRVSAVEAISSFTLGTRRKVYALFHEGSKDPTFIAHQVNVIAGLTDAAGQWNYDLTVTPTGTSFNNATTYAALETIFTSCAATPSTCPAALITSYLDQQFVDRAATLAAGAVNPIPYFVIGSSGATDANANAHVAQYIGVDDGQVGMQAAQMMIEAGATKPLCVGPSAAGPSYARRCAGFVSTYSSVKGVTAAELYTPTSLENAQALLKSKMQGTVYDGILCTMPELCTSLFAMLDTTPTIARPKYVYSIGMSVSVMEAITQGKMLGAVDTTPYTNGYIAMYHVGSLLEGSTIPSTQVVHIGQKNRTWACPPGYAFNADGNMYTRMPSGMMSAGSVCQPCPANSHAPAASTAICSACPLGTYADRTGAIRCASCDDGIGITVGYCANYFKGTEVTPSSRSAVRALGGIGLAVVGLLGAGLVVAQGEPIIRKASPALSSGVLVGSMFVVASTLLQQFDLSTGKCTSSMWLLATGFGLSVGCVFVKNLRVYRIFNNPRLRSQGLNFTYMAQQLAFILLGEWILLAIWTGVSAPTKLLTTSGSGKTYAACSSPKLAVQGAFSGLLILYNAALLIANVCIGFLNRNLQEDFSETQYISWASYNILVCSALAIAIGYLDIDIDFKWGVLFAMIILAAVGLPIILFATRLVRAYTDRKNASGDTGSEITSQPKSATGQKMMSFRKGSLNKGSGNIRPNTLNAMLTQNIPVAVHRGKMMSVWESYKATLIIIPRGAGVIIILTGSDTKESSEALTVGPGAFTPLMNPEAAADFMLFVVAANGRRTVSIQLEDAETYATWEAHFKAVARKKAQDTNTMPMSNGSGGATSGGREDDFV